MSRTILRPCPKVGEIFELTLNADLPENQPLAMVKKDGYNPHHWQHRGSTVEGIVTRKCMLLTVGTCCETFLQIKRYLAQYGDLPPGQWREAMKAQFLHNNEAVIGIADVSWVDPDGLGRFPCIYVNGCSGFAFVLGVPKTIGWQYLVLIR